MDVGPVSAQSPYRYQQAQPNPGPAAASREPVSTLAAASAVGSQGNALTANVPTGKPAGSAENQLSAINGLELPPTFHGMDASSAASLLASLDGGDGGGSQGFEAAINGGAIVAMAAYQVQLSFPGNPTPAETAATPSLAPPASVPAPAVAAPAATAQDSGSPGVAQQAVQAALNPTNLSLFA